MSQQQLGNIAGLSASYLSRLESGARTPHREVIASMARAMTLTPNETGELLMAAGFLPDTPAAVIAEERELVRLYALLAGNAIPSAAKDLIRMQLALIARQATLLGREEAN